MSQRYALVAQVVHWEGNEWVPMDTQPQAVISFAIFTAGEGDGPRARAAAWATHQADLLRRLNPGRNFAIRVQRAWLDPELP